MSLKDDKQQNIQIELDVSSARTGEARRAGREGAESSMARNGTENPASLPPAPTVKAVNCRVLVGGLDLQSIELRTAPAPSEPPPVPAMSLKTR